LNKFCGKVLLFGEYSVVKGGNGLALPFFDYSGQLEKNCGSVDSGLEDFAKFLRNSSILNDTLNVEAFMEDVQGGLRFNSDIPQGSGVGSSGALCAAIYSTYHKGKDLCSIQNTSDMSEVKDHMSLMESFYHGSSSGLDPLISLAQKPALVKNRNNIEFVDFKEKPKLNLYLYNTGVSRHTSPLVHEFLKQCEEPEYEKKTQEFIEISNQLILASMTNDYKSFDELFYRLSKWQYLNFRPMICSSVDSLWLEGLESKEFYLKLCGAGGGGHYIVYERVPGEGRFSKACKVQF
tara:strand:- start:239444 stop:240319 length:876 start_codon:yes stop_codon:yes gene_type:complete